MSVAQKQTCKASLAESLMNVALGYGIALASQIIVFPWFGINIPLSSNIAIGLIFRARCEARCLLIHNGLMDWHTAIDELQEVAVSQRLVAKFGQDRIQQIMAESFA